MGGGTERRQGDSMEKREAESQARRGIQREREAESMKLETEGETRTDRHGLSRIESFADSGHPFGQLAWAVTWRGSRRHTSAAQIHLSVLVSTEPVGTGAGRWQLEKVGPWIHKDPGSNPCAATNQANDCPPPAPRPQMCP